MAASVKRGVLVLGDGLAPVAGSAGLEQSALDRVAASGCCGQALLRDHPASLSAPCNAPLRRFADAQDEDARPVVEFLSIVGLYADIWDDEGELLRGPDAPLPSFADKFLGMRAGLLSASPAICRVAEAVGFKETERYEPAAPAPGGGGGAGDAEALGEELHRRAARMLSLEGGASAEGDPRCELVVVHVAGCEARRGVRALDALVAGLLPRERDLFLQLAFSHGALPAASAQRSPPPPAPGSLAALPPPQSCFFLRGAFVRNARVNGPLMTAGWHPGSVRRDGAGRFEEAEVRARGGAMRLLVDHLLPELAYKLGRAKKYGA
eukprot:tig00000880_g5198.t1